MKKKIEQILVKNDLCCIYYDETDTDMFLIGRIIAIDEEYFIIECITSKGYSNGLSCRLIDSIIKIETMNNYLKSVEKLWRFNNQKRLNFILQKKECLKAIIDFAVKNERISFIELCESGNIDAVGYIKEFNNEEVVVSRIDDCGKIDGEEHLNFEKISAITLANEEQIRLEILSKI